MTEARKVINTLSVSFFGMKAVRRHSKDTLQHVWGQSGHLAQEGSMTLPDTCLLNKVGSSPVERQEEGAETKESN